MDILLVRVIENKRYSGGKFVYCDVLLSPSVNDPNFESIDKEDWKWTSKNFEYPLFKNKKNGIFLVSLVKDTDRLSISIFEDDELQKKAQVGWDKHEEDSKKRWKELGERLEKSGFFKPRIEGTIEL